MVGSHHEEGGVCHSPGRGDDLTSSTMDGLVGNHRIKNLELHITDCYGNDTLVSVLNI